VRSRSLISPTDDQNNQSVNWSIFGFTVDFRAPSIPRFSPEWAGYLQNSGLHNSRKCFESAVAEAARPFSAQTKLAIRGTRDSINNYFVG
jgi:hypothetical protein